MSSDDIPINDLTIKSSRDNVIKKSSDINTSVGTTGAAGATGAIGAINQTSNTLKDINSIKDELCKLPLDPCESEYILNSVFPLTNTLYLLSTTAVNLSNTANILTISPIVHPKKTELKDMIDLAYDIDEECKDLFKVIKKRLKVLLK